jgi:hypothetical protein
MDADGVFDIRPVAVRLRNASGQHVMFDFVRVRSLRIEANERREPGAVAILQLTSGTPSSGDR